MVYCVNSGIFSFSLHHHYVDILIDVLEMFLCYFSIFASNSHCILRVFLPLSHSVYSFLFSLSSYLTSFSLLSHYLSCFFSHTWNMNSIRMHPKLSFVPHFQLRNDKFTECILACKYNIKFAAIIRINCDEGRTIVHEHGWDGWERGERKRKIATVEHKIKDICFCMNAQPRMNCQQLVCLIYP